MQGYARFLRLAHQKILFMNKQKNSPKKSSQVKTVKGRLDISRNGMGYVIVDGEEKDASIRPNQIFAVSLPHTMLDSAAARKVVDKVEAELRSDDDPMGRFCKVVGLDCGTDSPDDAMSEQAPSLCVGIRLKRVLKNDCKRRLSLAL